MVGRDAGAHEAPGGRQALDHVDLDVGVGVLEEMPGRVEAGGAGSDYRDADWRVFVHLWLKGGRGWGTGMGAARLERATPSV